MYMYMYVDGVTCGIRHHNWISTEAHSRWNFASDVASCEILDFKRL